MTPSTLRLPLAFGVALMALAPAGCVRSRREVMLILTTNLACPTIDRVTVRLARGAGSTNYTWQQTFALSGTNCSTTSNGGLSSIPIPMVPEYKLGIVDGRRTDERVRIEVEALGQVGVRTVAETDFVDDKVYAVPLELSYQCQGPEMCPSGYTCRVVPGTAQAGCGSVYRRPGTLGTFLTSMSVVSDDEATLP